MSEFSSPSAEPSYIARLALQSAPFNAAVDAAIFYKGEQIEQRFNLLLHLIRASDKVGLLNAAQGLGKSTLLTQLQQNKGNDLRICRINGHASLTSIDIIMQCLSAFGADEQEVQFNNDHLTLLKDRLSRLRQLNIKPLLLIDDIDLLDKEPLAVLMNCLSWQDGSVFLLCAVLTTKHDLPALSTIQGRLQRIDLPALTEHEVALYLNDRLQAVGYKGESVFSSKDLKQCYRQTAGNPALVNQWAHQHLLGMKPRLTHPVKLNFGRVMSLLRWSGLALLVITLIFLLLFQDTINALFAPKTTDVAIIEQPFMAQDEPLATVILDDDNVTSAAQAERDQLTALVSELPAVNIAPIDKPEPSVQHNLVPNAGIVAPAPIVVVEPKSKSLVAEASPEIHQQDWILRQNSTDYTFQLMGSWAENEVTEFLDKYALTGDVAEFESERSGRVWYALIYGVYDSKQAALDASRTWPAPLNTLPSWLRRFDSVQQQIKKTAPMQ